MKLQLDKSFDTEKCRHYVNNRLTVLHCHHYATLFTQLAIDAKDIVEGTKILYETSETVFFEVLKGYFEKNNITDKTERLGLAQEMLSAVGLGKIEPDSFDESGGLVEMPVSHIDEGWLKKWGKHDSPVNYIGAGYIAAMYSAAFDKPVRTYKVEEQESMVTGAKKTVLKVSL